MEGVDSFWGVLNAKHPLTQRKGGVWMINVIILVLEVVLVIMKHLSN